MYTALFVGILEWAVMGATGNEARHRVEGLFPGGVSGLGLTWALGSIATLVGWLRVRSSPVTGLVVAALYGLLMLYLEQWARRVALATSGGISPSEVWLYLSGGRVVAYGFGLAIAIVVAVGVVRGLDAAKHGRPRSH